MMYKDMQVWKLHKDAVLPVRMTRGSVGYDICAIQDYFIQKGEFVILKTGLVVRPPDGCHLEIALRSSMPNKKGLLIPHGMGIIDQDYCGEKDELGVPVYKFGFGIHDHTWTFSRNAQYGCHIKKGSRIAQLIIRQTITTGVKDCTGKPFPSPSRGGFGSTGDK